MSVLPEIQAEVGRWVVRAENDLRNAEYVLTLEEDCPTDTICFHAHQCAEKYLKAMLLFQGLSFPRTHDLVVLLNLISSQADLDLGVEDLYRLNRYSVEARYPGEWDLIDLMEAKEAVRMARQVRTAIRKVLPEEALPGGDISSADEVRD